MARNFENLQRSDSAWHSIEVSKGFEQIAPYYVACREADTREPLADSEEAVRSGFTWSWIGKKASFKLYRKPATAGTHDSSDSVYEIIPTFGAPMRNDNGGGLDCTIGG